MFKQLETITEKPKAFSIYTVDILWTRPHIAANMLKFHIDPDSHAASRKQSFIDKSVDFIARTFSIDGETSLIDFGCGPGLYTSSFAKLGAKVTGVDFSENSLNYAKGFAKDNGLDITYHQANYLDYEPSEQYDVATLIYCDYCAIGPDKRKQLLDTVMKSLKPGGSFILDVHTMERFRSLKEATAFDHMKDGGFFSPDEFYQFTSSYLYPEEGVSLDHYTIIEDGSTWHIYNWLQHFNKETITKELQAAGFEVIGYFDTISGEPYTGSGHDMAITCIKN